MKPKCPECNSNDLKFFENTQRFSCSNCGNAFKVIKDNEEKLRIFLSYGHDSNEELVRLIKADLEKSGHDVWFDKNKIKFGDDWRHEITDGIVNSNKFISFLSKHSTRDPGVCLDEIAIAIGVKGGNISTILVEGETEVQAPPSISHIQWLDMHNWKEQQAKDETSWNEWYQEKLDEIIRVVESEESRQFAGEIEKLANYLKPISSDSRVSQLLSKGFVGREWMWDEVEKWRTNPDHSSRLFWIMGVPGVGKSAFAAHFTHFGRDKIIAAQFCEWNKPDHRNAARVFRSIAFQLATRLPDYRKLLLTLPEINQLDGKNAAEIFDYLFANPLQKTIQGGRERYLILIDALDEAAEGERNDLVETLAKHAPELPEWLGMLITSRPESSVTSPLQGLKPYVLDTGTEENKDDIRLYLFQELKSLLEKRNNANELVEQILEKSEGVFLYVERVCDDLNKDYLSLDNLDQFPIGLGGIFKQFFDRQFPDLEYFRSNIRPALRAILAAREPLPLDILKNLFDWQEEEMYDFIRVLGSLFPVIEEGGRKVIKPYHKSLIDWLTNQSASDHYFVNTLEGHRLLADYGWELYTTEDDNLDIFFVKWLPSHLQILERWDDLTNILCDLNFIQIKCMIGMTYNLVKDYELALNELPEAEIDKVKEIQHQETIKKYIEEMILYANNWNNIRKKNELNQIYIEISEKEIPLPEIINSVKPLDFDAILKTIRLSNENLSRFTKIKAFSMFVNTECSTILKYAHIKGFLYQHAYNCADSGVVAKQAEKSIIKDKQSLFLLKEVQDKPRYNPFPGLVKTFEGHTDIIWDVKITPDAKFAISAGNDGTIRIWDIKNGDYIKILESNSGKIFSLNLSFDGKTLIAGGNDKNLQIWNIETDECKTIRGHNGTIQGVDQTPDARMIISRGMDKKVYTWISDVSIPQKIFLNTFYISSFCLTPDGEKIFTAGPNIRKYNSQTGELVVELTDNSDYLSSMDITPDGNKIISGCYDSSILFWDIALNKHFILKGHTKRIRSVKMTPDGRIAVSGGDDKTIRIWDIENQTCIKVFEGHTDTITSVSITPDGKSLATSSFDKTVRIWDLYHGIVLKKQNNPANSYVRGEQFNNESELSLLFNLMPEKTRKRINDYIKRKNIVKLSPDGRTFISSGFDKLIRIWDVKTDQCIRIYKGHIDIISSLCISNSGDFIVSASEDKSVRVWDKHKNDCIAIFQNSSKIESLCFSNNNSHLILFGNDNNRIRIRLDNFDTQQPHILTIKRKLESEGLLSAQNPPHSIYATCKCCNEKIPISETLLDLIIDIRNRNNDSKEKNFLLNLPIDAWENKNLVSECPHCHQNLKFNPFIVDQI